MATNTGKGNRLVQIQRLQRATDDHLTRAAATVDGARARRAAALGRFDLEVSEAEAARDVALGAHLEIVKDPELAADSGRVDLATVRVAVRRADPAAVAELLATLGAPRSPGGRAPRTPAAPVGAARAARAAGGQQVTPGASAAGVTGQGGLERRVGESDAVAFPGAPQLIRGE